MPTFIVNKNKKEISFRKLFAILFWMSIGIFFGCLIHEFGHCVFYWIQGIPAAMSLTKEFPLIDITVRQYSIGSFGGILFTWLGMIIFFLLQLYFLKNGKKGKLIISSIFFGQIMLGLIFLILFILSGFSTIQENTFAESFFHLPQNSFFILTVLLTLFFFFLYIKQLNLTMRNKDFLFFLGYLFTGIVSLMLIGGIDQQFFRKGYPTIKIGNVMLYNEPLPNININDSNK